MYYCADLVNAFLFHTWWEPFVPLVHSVAFFAFLYMKIVPLRQYWIITNNVSLKKGLNTFHGQTTIPPVKFFTGLNSFRGKSKSV